MSDTTTTQWLHDYDDEACNAPGDAEDHRGLVCDHGYRVREVYTTAPVEPASTDTLYLSRAAREALTHSRARFVTTEAGRMWKALTGLDGAEALAHAQRCAGDTTTPTGHLAHVAPF